MQSSDFPFLADWFAISLRWACLLGFAVALSLVGAVNTPVGVLLLLFAVWNLVMSMLAVINKRLLGHRYLNVFVDLLLSVLLFTVTRDLSGPLAWAGLLPLISSAIYFGWSGSLVVGVLLLVVQALVIFLRTLSVQWAGISLLAVINIVGGILLGLGSIPLLNRLRQNYKIMVRDRQETEMVARRKERDRMQAFYQMIETLSASLDYNLVLNTTLDLCTTAIAEPGETTPLVQQMVSAVLLFEGHDLKVATAHKFPPPDMRRTFPAEQGALVQAVQGADPVVVQNPSRDPELGRLLCLQGCRALLLLPLRRGLDSYGVILFAHPDPYFFDPNRIETLQVISHQAVIAIQNARLYQEMEMEKQRIIEIQEEARKKLARDLHDGPTQSVAAIAMRLNIVRMMIEMNPKEATDEAAKLEDLARRTTQEIRHMLFTLRPLALETGGLKSALQAMADKMHETFSQDVSIEVDEEAVQKLDTGKQTVIFYIAEEAVNNARKHARASRIQLKLGHYSRDPGCLLLEVNDNGTGFDVAAVNLAYEKRGSLGMVNLRERADLVNGLLRINSAPGKGTRVLVLIPLNEETADRLQRGLVGN